MSQNELDGASIIAGGIAGLFFLLCAGGLVLVIGYISLLVLGIVAILAALYGLVSLLIWLWKEHPVVLGWIVIIAATVATGFGLWQLGAWLWEAHQQTTITGAFICSVLFAAYRIVSMYVEHLQEKKKVAQKKEQDDREAKLLAKATEAEKHQRFLEGQDMQLEIDNLQCLFQQRLMQHAAAKENARRLQREIEMHRASGDPAQVLPLCMTDARKEDALILKLTYEAARTWTRMTLLEKIKHFTVLLRQVPDLSVLKRASLMDNPKRAKSIFASLWQTLSGLCDQMDDELRDQRILDQRPPLEDELYPLVESYLRLAHKQMCERFDAQLRELAKQVARLHYLEGAAERAHLHREANLDGTSSCWSAEIAELVQEAVDRLARTVDETKQHLADAEVESTTQTVIPRAIQADDFVDPLELDQFRARKAASKLRQPS